MSKENKEEPLTICKFCESTTFPIRLEYLDYNEQQQVILLCCKDRIFQILTALEIPIENPIRLRYPVANGNIIQNYLAKNKQNLIIYLTEENEISSSEDILYNKTIQK